MKAKLAPVLSCYVYDKTKKDVAKEWQLPFLLDWYLSNINHYDTLIFPDFQPCKIVLLCDTLWNIGSMPFVSRHFYQRHGSFGRGKTIQNRMPTNLFNCVLRYLASKWWWWWYLLNCQFLVKLNICSKMGISICWRMSLRPNFAMLFTYPRDFCISLIMRDSLTLVEA